MVEIVEMSEYTDDEEFHQLIWGSILNVLVVNVVERN